VVYATDSVHFDRTSLLSKIGNEEVLQSLFLMSKTEYPKYIQEIANAIESGDEKEIKQKAHKLKGSALNMEFVALGEIAKRIEASASNKGELADLIRMLENEWNTILNELK